MSEESSMKPGALAPRPDPGPGPGNSSLPSFYSSNQTHFARVFQTGRRALRCGQEIMPGKRTTRGRLTSCFTHCKQFSGGRLKHITGGWGAPQPSTGTPTAHSPLPGWDQHSPQPLKPTEEQLWKQSSAVQDKQVSIWHNQAGAAICVVKSQLGIAVADGTCSKATSWRTTSSSPEAEQF